MIMNVVADRCLYVQLIYISYEIGMNALELLPS